MSRYMNGCACERCKTRGYMGPAILITLGIILLLDQMNYVDFWRSAPVLLIVIGLVKILQGNASTEGHVSPPYQVSPPYMAYPHYVTPVPPDVPPAAPSTPHEGQVSNG